MAEPIILTQEGIEKLEEELEYLVTVRRREMSERLKQAIELGDLSENSEYEDAKRSQGMLEGRVMEIEDILSRAQPAEDGAGGADGVAAPGAWVILKETSKGTTMEFQIVGPAEVDAAAKRFSYESPIGAAVNGRSVGDTVQVAAPAGVFNYQVVSVGSSQSGASN